MNLRICCPPNASLGNKFSNISGLFNLLARYTKPWGLEHGEPTVRTIIRNPYSGGVMHFPSKSVSRLEVYDVVRKRIIPELVENAMQDLDDNFPADIWTDELPSQNVLEFLLSKYSTYAIPIKLDKNYISK